MSLTAQIARNTTYQIGGKVSGVILGLLTIGLITRYLGQAGFGYYTTAIAFLQFFGVLVDFGLQMTAAQMLSKPGADERKIFNNIFSLRLFSAVAFLGLACLLVWLTPYPLLIKQAVLIGSFSFLFISLQTVLIGLFQKKMNMADTAKAEIISRLTLLVGVALAVFSNWGLLAIVAMVSCGSFSACLYLYFKSKKYFSLRLAFDWPIWREIWQVSWPLAITISLSLVYFRADTIVLSLFRSPAEVGLYGAAYKVLEVLAQLPYLFLGLMLPLFTQFLASNRKIFTALFQKSFDFLMILILPMIFAIWLLGEKIMIFVAGPEFGLSGQLLKILILAVALIYLGALMGYGIVAAGLQKKMIKFYLLDAVVSLILYLIFIPVYGYFAAAILTVMTELFITLSAYYIMKRYIGITISWQRAGKALMAALAMSAVLLLLINQNLLTLVIVGVLIYFTALYLLRGISKQTALEMIKYRN